MTGVSEHHVEPQASTERIESGIPGLDRSLGGGFLRGGVFLVMGHPGAGKTTLGNQMVFTHAGRGERAAYVSLLSESTSSMIKHLTSFEFYKSSLVHYGVQYVGAYKALREAKLRGLLEMLRRLMSDDKPTLLVLDGISPVRQDGDLALKEFIAELQTLASLMNVTVIMLSNVPSEAQDAPEHTMVDGLVELAMERHSRRTTRTLEVVKLRGSNHLLGKQELVIDQTGLNVYPRAEAIFDGSLGPAVASTRRDATGITTLDVMLEGGLWSGTSTMLLGFSGSGKTTLALQFLSTGASKGENVLYMGFYEPPQRLLAIADSLGLDLRKQSAEGKFAQIWQPPYELGPDALAQKLFDDVTKREVSRVVLDGLDGFVQAAIEPSRTIRYVTALSNELRKRDITTILTDETPMLFGPAATRVQGISAMVDNIFLLEYMTIGSELRRFLTVLKQRGGHHVASVREMFLTGHGIQVSPDSKSAEEALRNASELTGIRGGAGRYSLPGI